MVLADFCLPERVTKLVENHVQAKRYLTYVDADYYHQLSEVRLWNTRSEVMMPVMDLEDLKERARKVLLSN